MSRSEGTRGEALAADYLRERGCRLVAHSFSCRFGEIDLIAWDGDVLCFVEVKTRTNLMVGLPREYVTAGKQARIRKTALYFLQQQDLLEAPCRFDVAEVYLTDDGALERIEYINDAFI